MTIIHIERIECPSCNHAQEAIIKETALYPVRVHQCAACGYWITESEWNPCQFKPTTMSPRRPETRPAGN